MIFESNGGVQKPQKYKNPVKSTKIDFLEKIFCMFDAKITPFRPKKKNVKKSRLQYEEEKSGNCGGEIDK